MSIKFMDWIKKCNWAKDYKYIAILAVTIISIGALALLDDYLCQIFNGFWEWLGKTGNSAKHTETNSATLRNLALAIFGSVGLTLATWRSIIADKNTQIADRNSLIAEDNSITDAFTRAIEQLGSGSDDKPNIEVRLGAIYALERLSQKNDDYYQAIIDILVSYVRHNAPIPLEDTRSPTDKTRIDMQTAMTVLGRREVKTSEPQLNLVQVYLPKVNLNHAYLQGANLNGADLRGADLQGAYLNGADLKSAYLNGANLQRTDLNNADLQRAYLNGANLQNVYLSGADLQYAHLIGAILQRAMLYDSNLQCTYLNGADLQGAFLKGTDLRDTDLAGAKGLCCEQLKEAKNWQLAHRDEELACGADIP